MKRFVIGDIHARHEALLEVIEKSGIDRDNDLLIILGDVVDGGRDTKKVIDELLTFKNRVFVIGNHDVFFLKYLADEEVNPYWINQGGAATLNSYGGRVVPNDEYLEDDPVVFDVSNIDIPEEHIDFLMDHRLTYVLDGMLFVHAGIVPGAALDEQTLHTLTWDRKLIEFARWKSVPDFEHVFIGHTTTQAVNGETRPLTLNNLTMLDTGAGWSGKLTLMDVDTREYWQSSVQVPNRRG